MRNKRIGIKSLYRFIQLPFLEQKVAIEAFFYLTYSRLLLLTMSFKKLAAKFGEPMTETSFKTEKKAIEVAQILGKSIKKMSLYTPFRSLCFEQAIALTLLLKKRSIPSTIYLGIQKEKHGKELKAHAWTRVGNAFITGKKGKDDYVVISTFAQQKP